MFSLVLMAIGFGGLLFSSWPVEKQKIEIPINDTDRESGKLILVVPTVLHAGDKFTISLQVDHISAQNNNVSAEAQVNLITRLDLAGIDFTPKGEGKVTLPAGHTAEFRWQLDPLQCGKFNGTIWLFEKGEDGSRQLILARQIHLTVKNVWGMTYANARTISILVFAVGLLFSSRPLFRRMFSALQDSGN